MRRILLALLTVGLCAADAAAQSAVSVGPVELDRQGACAVLDVSGMGSGVWDVGGTFTGTVTFYVRGVLGANRAIDVAPPDDPGATINSATAGGSWQGPVAGWRAMVACMTEHTSGAAVVGLSADATGGGGGGGGSATIGGDIELEVGAQPADDPHFVQCSDGSQPAACVVSGTVTIQDGGNTITVDGSVTVTATNLDVQSGGADLATSSQMTTLTGHVDGLESDTASIASNTSTTSSNTSSIASSATDIVTHTSETASNTAGILAALQADEVLIACDRSAEVVGKSTTGLTEVIPAPMDAGDVVHICSYTVMSEGTTTWQLQQGTGTDCASDGAALPGAAAWSFSATTGMLGVNRGGGIGSVLHADAGQAVCVTQGSAVQTHFEIRYTYITPPE